MVGSRLVAGHVASLNWEKKISELLNRLGSSCRLGSGVCDYDIRGVVYIDLVVIELLVGWVALAKPAGSCTKVRPTEAIGKQMELRLLLAMCNADEMEVLTL